jgi:catechol 2,3-dioxygenase-like lactoylglutathione lyase family enzyme
MKRLHVSVAVSDIEESVDFYCTLFAAEPSVRKPDYAKWMLDDPRVNFSISSRGTRKGVDHLGLQVDDDAELATIADRLAKAGRSVHRQKATTCCYAQSNKVWVHDPEGVAWETFHTFGESLVYGEERDHEEEATAAEARACCTPTAEETKATSCCALAADRPRTMADLARSAFSTAFQACKTALRRSTTAG